MIPANDTSLVEGLVRRFGTFFHVPALVRLPERAVALAYERGNPLNEEQAAEELVRDVLAAAAAAKERHLTLAEIEQSISATGADHFGQGAARPLNLFDVKDADAVDGDIPARLLAAVEQFAELPYWAVVAPGFDPYVLVAEENAFLFTDHREAAPARPMDAEAIVYDLESWTGADFPGIEKLLGGVRGLDDELFTSLEQWRTLPSPAALLRLREAQVLMPEVSTEHVFREAQLRFS